MTHMTGPLPDYAELHCLSNFSFLRGASHPEELFERAAALGYSGLAITDECSLAGVVRAHLAAREYSVPLIIGSELTTADGLRCVLLATDRASYGGLAQLITDARRASPKGSYLLTREQLAAPGPNGCLALWLPGAEPSVEAADFLAQCFPGRVWIAVELLLEGRDSESLQQLKRIGIELPRATLATWMVRAGAMVQPLINLLRERMLDYPVLAMDETRLQVLKEPGRAAQSQSYLWVQRGGPPDRPVVLFDYDASRAQSVPIRLLAEYAGFLQTDGYEGYAKACADNGITALGCWAHARRKFDEALKAQGKGRKSKDKSSLAAQALKQIQLLYQIERKAKHRSADERLAIRQAQSQPVLDALHAWLQTHQPLVPPQSALGKAMAYLHNQWDKLVVYVTDGRLAIDNNATENAIRPFVIGRKNFLFCDTVAGALASANLYSLIESAKANGIEPYGYLTSVFTALPNATTVEDIEALLPLADQTAQRDAA